MWGTPPKLSPFSLASRFTLRLGVWVMSMLCLLPASNAFAAQVALAWDASPGPSVTGYKLYYGLASSSYTVDLDVGMSLTTALSGLVPGNAYYFAVTAYDGYGQESAFSNETTYTVLAADTTPPTVSITSPLDGTVVKPKSIVAIRATASDDVGVTRVEFYVNGNLKRSDTTSPYACALKVPAAPRRTYQLQAIAYDAVGNVGSSGLIKVTSQ